MADLRIFTPEQSFLEAHLHSDMRHPISQTFVHVYKDQIPNTAIFIYRGKYSFGDRFYIAPKTGALVFLKETLNKIPVKEALTVSKGAHVVFFDRKHCLRLSELKPIQEFLNRVSKT